MMKYSFNLPSILLFALIPFMAIPQKVARVNLPEIHQEFGRLPLGEKVNFLGCKTCNIGKQNLPVYSERRAISTSSFKLEIVSENWQELDFSSNDFEQVIFPDKLMVESKLVIDRKKKYAQINIVPLKKEGTKIFKLVSLDYRLIAIQSSAAQRTNRIFATESVLNSGTWHQIGITSRGVYKISFNNLESWGVINGTINSNEIHIYGNQFGSLPIQNNQNRPDDLLQNAIEMHDGGDGTLDDGDYFLFYANGPDKIYRSGNELTFDRNGYSDSAYYYVHLNAAVSPKWIAHNFDDPSPANYTTTSFNDMLYYEPDQINFIESGIEWYGDEFDAVDHRDYDFGFPNRTNDSVLVEYVVLSSSVIGTGSFDISVANSNYTDQVSIGPVGSGTYAFAAKPSGVKSFLVNPSTDNVEISLDYNKPNASSKGFLDYFKLNARRELITSNGALIFTDILAEGSNTEFQLNYTNSDIRVWNITDPTNTYGMSLNKSGTVATFNQDQTELQQYVSVSGSTFSSPSYVKEIANQNLHGLAQTDYIIISNGQFISEANRLANFHREKGLHVTVVEERKIFNEFSSGMVDPVGIRDFCRMFYDRAGSDSSLFPKYLLLFGDGSYDNKHRVGNNSNYITTFQSYFTNHGLDILQTFTADDFFGMLDTNESFNVSDQMDIGIGRFPVRSISEATAMVDKTISYYEQTFNADQSVCIANGGTERSNLGDWRNKILFVADDEDGNGYINNAQSLEDEIQSQDSVFMVDKLFIDAYQQVSTSSGNRYPVVEEQLRNKVQNGVLMVNYVGHGGETGWTEERILGVNTIQNWTNTDRLAVFVTATCEFARFDDPDRTSAGEMVVLNPNGGAVAALTTTRLTFSNSNLTLNRNLFENAFDEMNGQVNTLGEVIRLTKNQSALQLGTYNFRNFTLLGDPALPMNVPKHHVYVDSINGTDVAVVSDTLKALSKVRVKGHISNNPSGAVSSSFNGYLYPTIYDKPAFITTLQNDPSSTVKTFDLFKNVIYKGKASVENGYFDFTFMVPKDIALNVDFGKMSFYAVSENGPIDAHGYQSVKVGAANDTAGLDNVGPSIELYMNDESFVDGGMTDETPQIYAKIFDENGVNTTGSGLGHDITAVIDENTANAIILNDYYEADLNSFQSGEIRYALSELEPGEHTLTLKVWDSYNNSSEEEIRFVVEESSELKLKHIYNYPNPFTTNTEFMFEHNRTCEDLDVMIQVFTISGKLVKTIHNDVTCEGYRVAGIMWDGKDEFGDQLAKGVYIYAVSVRTPSGESETELQKLVILK
jgi:hypothetical protein